MYCKHCGKEVDKDAAFCSHCGGRLKEDVEEKRTSLDDVWDETPAQEFAQADASAQAQPQAQPQSAQGEKENGMAIAGFVCSFFVPVLGWVFGGIGLSKALKRGGKGKGFAIAALAIATGNFLLGLMSNACYSLLLF